MFLCSLDWQAIATFVTGLLAVGGAVLVGKRQTKILEKQTDIQELSVRSDLFDRRFENYETVRDFLMSAMSLTGEPNPASLNKFFAAQREARFLFGSEVHDELQRIWQDCIEMFSATELTRTGVAPEGVDYQAEIARKADHFGKISASFNNLHELYHQLNLGLVK